MKLARLALLVLLLVLALPLPGALTPSSGEPGPQDSGERLVLVVLPLYDQEPSGGRVIFLRAYERIYAVLDLNHNGVRDEGEPVVDIREPGRVVATAIGWAPGVSDYYVSMLNESLGSVWLLVKPPVMVWYAAYDASGGIVAAYSMPPPGRRIVVPPIPGTVYLSPASPEGANVTVRGGPGGSYRVGSGEYLVLPAGAEPYMIEADRPVAAVLANVDGSPGSYAVELVPVEEQYTTSGTLPLAESTARSLAVESGPSVYYVVASPSGETTTGRLLEPESIERIAGGPGVGYLVLEHNGSVSAVPVYNVYAHPALQGAKGYLVSQAIVEAFRPGERLKRIMLSPLGPGASFSLAADVSGDRVVDYYLHSVRVPPRNVTVLTAGLNGFERLTAYLPEGARILPVLLEGRGDYGRAFSTIILSPVPGEASQPPMIPDARPGLGNVTVASAPIVFAAATRPQGEYVRIHATGRIGPVSCGEAESVIVGVMLSDALETLLSRAGRGCSLEILAAKTVATPLFTVIFQPYIVTPDRLVALPGVALSNTSGGQRAVPGALPGMGERSGPEQGVYASASTGEGVYVDGDYWTVKPLDYPRDHIWNLERWTLLDLHTLLGIAPASPDKEIPPGVRDGDEIRYGITIEGTYGESTIREAGWLVLVARVAPEYWGESEAWLTPLNTTLSPRARYLLGLAASVSDLLRLAYTGPGHRSRYNLEGTVQAAYECPIIGTGPEGQMNYTVNYTVKLGNRTIDYTCAYSGGILESLTARMQGPGVDVVIRALKSRMPPLPAETGSPGGAATGPAGPSGRPGGGAESSAHGQQAARPLGHYAIIAVIIVIAAMAALVAALRR